MRITESQLICSIALRAKFSAIGRGLGKLEYSRGVLTLGNCLGTASGTRGVGEPVWDRIWIHIDKPTAAAPLLPGAFGPHVAG